MSRPGRGRRPGARGAAVAFVLAPPSTARSGASESLVTSPAHTRSHSAASSLGVGGAGRGAADLRPEAGAALARAASGSRRATRPSGARQRLERRREQRQLVGEEQPHPTVGRADRAGTDPHQVARRAQLVEVGRAVAAHPQRQHVGLERAGARSPRPAACPIASTRPSRPRRSPGMPCQLARNRAYASCSTGSTSGAARPATGGAAGAARRRRTTRARRRPAGTRRARRAPRPRARRAHRRSAVAGAAEAAGHVVGDGTGRGCARSGRPATRAGAATGSVKSRGSPSGSAAPERIAVARRILGGDVARLVADARARRPAARAPAPPATAPTRRPRSAGRPPPARGRRPCAARRAARRPMRARRPSVRHCSSSSRSASTPGSSSSRSSSAPSRSRSRSRSSASAAARRSASGASPSYMYAAIQLNSRLCANGDAFGVSTLTTRIGRLRSWPSTSRSAGRSNTSCRHSRDVSSRIGKLGYLEATASRSAARWRCCHSGVRRSGRRRGSSSARAAHSRKRAENSDVCGSDEITSSSMSSGSMIELVERHLVGRLRQAQDDAVVAPHRLDRDVEAVDQPPLDRHRPRRVHRRAERAEDADPPVADLVAEPLDHDRAVVGHRHRWPAPARRGTAARCSRRTRRASSRSASARQRLRRAAAPRISRWNAPSARPSSSGRPGRSPCQNGILPGCARRRRDDDALERDVLDAPRGRTEQERLARPALVHHLLVELADAGAVGQEHAEQAAVGDGAAAGDGQPLRAVAGAQRVVDPIPHEARAQLAELLARVATGEQVEHVVQQLVADLGEARRTGGPSPRASATGQSPRDRDVGDDLLREHVERVAQEAGGLDLPVDHPPHDDRGLEQVAAVLRVERALARLADRVTGATDALQPAADRARRLDLDDEVDRAHVDAQLEAAGGDDGAQLAALQLVFDDDALLAGERAVVRLDQLDRRAVLRRGVPERLGVQLVQLRGEPLGLPAGVAEDDGAAVLEHLLEDPRVDARPDAGRAAARAQPWPDRCAARPGAAGRGRPCPRPGRRPRPRAACGCRRRRWRPDAARRSASCPPRKWATSSSGRCVADSPMRCGGRLVIASSRSSDEHQVRAALGGGHRVDLVDDDGLDVDERARAPTT